MTDLRDESPGLCSAGRLFDLHRGITEQDVGLADVGIADLSFRFENRLAQS